MNSQRARKNRAGLRQTLATSAYAHSLAQINEFAGKNHGGPELLQA
jgi:hypothetical protein